MTTSCDRFDEKFEQMFNLVPIVSLFFFHLNNIRESHNEEDNHDEKKKNPEKRQIVY